MKNKNQSWLDELAKTYKLPKNEVIEKKQILTESQCKNIQNGKR